MLAFAWQFGLGNHPTKGNAMPAFIILGGFTIGGGLLLLVLNQLVPRLRRRVHSRRAQRRRLHAAAGSELRSRMQMDELCPEGWQAHIIVFSSPDQLPPEAPEPEKTRVALDWAQLGPGVTSDNVVVRRVWADSVGRALEAMVADRVTDETLLEIEQLALADGAEWPDE